MFHVIQLTESLDLDTSQKPLALRIFEEPDPQGVYCIGADVAAGVGEEIGDASAAQVIDVRTLKQVAQYHSWEVDPFQFGRDLDLLGRYYGGLTGLAHIVVEANNQGTSTLEVLKVECVYWNLYAQRQFAPQPEVNGKRRFVNRVGYWMTPQSRDVLVDDARRVWARVSSEEYLKLFGSPIRDSAVWKEMGSFRYTKTPSGRGKYAAVEGKHDDLVIALALAWFGRSTALYAAPQMIRPRDEPPDAEFWERENDMIQQFMLDRGVSWSPEEKDEYVKVKVEWTPQS